MFTLLKENQINALIPDGGNLTNSIHVQKKGKIKDIKVKVNVSDSEAIAVKLTSPSGKEVALNGNSDEVLKDFIGEQVQGDWTLVAHSDSEKNTFNSWGLELDCEAFQNSPTEIFIPEVESKKSLISTQHCQFDGRVTQAEVEVEIEHPLIGDLVVSIVSPDGREVLLHDRSGGSQKQIKKQWGGDALAGLVGVQTKGVWTLKIKNFHSSNNGKLKHWKVKFHYEAEDDLKVVEGIGPKIEELLKNAGIYSYVDLAATSSDRIKDILSAAGDRFNMHDPTTWPKQSGLAAQGKWEELNALKEVLDGGKAVK